MEAISHALGLRLSCSRVSLTMGNFNSSRQFGQSLRETCIKNYVILEV